MNSQCHGACACHQDQAACLFWKQPRLLHTAWNLDWSNKCFQFNITTWLASAKQGGPDNNEREDEHKPDSEIFHVSHYHTPTHRFVNYFETAKELTSSTVSNTALPPRIFASSTTAFHLAVVGTVLSLGAYVGLIVLILSVSKSSPKTAKRLQTGLDWTAVLSNCQD